MSAPAHAIPRPVLSWRELAVLVAIPLAWYIALSTYVREYIGGSWFWAIQTWDGAWFNRIRARGYELTDPTFETQQSFAFFPGIAWTGRVFDWFLPTDLAMYGAGLFWGVATAVLVGVAARHVGLDPIASTLVMAAYPAVFFTFLFYSDGIAITGSALIMIAVFGRRPVAGFVGGFLVGIARPVALGINGFALVVALVRGEGRPREVFSSGAGMAVGLGSVLIAQHQAGDAFGFLKAQGAWDRHVAYPFGAFVDAIHEARSGPMQFIDVYTIGSMVAVTVMVVVLVRASRRGEWPWTLTALAFAAAMLPMATNDSSGHLRYLMHAWPAWIYLTLWLPRRWMQVGLVLCAAPFTLWLMGRFAVGQLLVS